MEFPPAIPFTFQITAVFGVFCTVAVNCRVCFTRTEALVGEIVMVIAGGVVTLTKKVFDVSPSGVFTMTGTDDLAVGALPVAVRLVDDSKLVASAAPSNDTTEPATNPTPSTVSATAAADQTKTATASVTVSKR